VKDPGVLLDAAPEELYEGPAIVIVANDVTALVAARRDVPDGTAIIESKRTGHTRPRLPRHKDNRLLSSASVEKSASKLLGTETRRDFLLLSVEWLEREQEERRITKL